MMYTILSGKGSEKSYYLASFFLAKYTLVVLCGTKLYIHNFGVVLGTNVYNALLFLSTVYGKILF